ncbi:MAG: redoxin family protein [Alphaproteobacteria bacterium]|nr:redoxin family protein [Alphaproteobacteria bacterium]
MFSRERWSLIAGVAAAAALTAAALIVSANEASAATPGDLAPAFEELNSAGGKVSLADFKGRTVVLEWTNDGCPFVQKHYNSGAMQSLQASARRDGIVWLSVVSSKPGSQGHVTGTEADRLTAERKASPAHVLLDPDGSMGRAFGAKTTPHMFVIGPDGRIVYSGAIDSIRSSDVRDVPRAVNYVSLALEALKAGRPPETTLTVPYGCSVKY